MTMKRLLFAPVTLAAVLFSFSAHTNLVVNGSFRGRHGRTPGQATRVYHLDCSRRGRHTRLDVTHGSIDYIGTYWTAADGVRNGHERSFAGTIAYQTLVTTPRTAV